MTEVTGKLTYDLGPLTSMRKKLAIGYAARVGILGGDATEQHDGDSGLTNAEIGLIHILGSFTHNIPIRDFLLMPIQTKRDEIRKFFGQKEIRAMVEKGQILEVIERFGFFAETIVQRAFVTAGFGQWPALQPETIRRKGSSKPLIDTGQLRRAISSDVVTE